MSSVAQGAVVAATRACFTESRRPQSRRAQSAPRSGRVAGRRAGSVTVRLVRARAADADSPAASAAGNLQAESMPRDLEPLVYRFEGDSATIVSARTGKLLRRDVAPDAKRFGCAVNNNAVSVPAKARAGATDAAVPGTVAATVPGVPGDASSSSSAAVPAPLAEAATFAAETYAFAEDGSATVFAADGTRLRKHGVSGRLASFLTGSAGASAEEKKNAERSTNENALSADSRLTANVAGNAVALRRGVENAVAFVVNGAPKKPASASPVAASAQAWIDAWAAGAPAAKLSAIKASREEAEKNDATPPPEPEVTTQAPPSFDLGDMDLAESTPGGASRFADPDERDYPDSVFVSDDEADQEAMEDVLGTPAKETPPEKPPSETITDVGSSGDATASATASATKTRRAAFFDLDGTLARSNVVAQYAAWKMSTLNAFQKLLWVPFYALKCAVYLLVDKVSRSAFNEMFARDFKGERASEAAKREMARVSFESYLSARLFPAALEAIRVLKAQGFEIVLVTGSLDFMVEPVAALVGADAVIANELETTSVRNAATNEERELAFTGALRSAAVADDEKRVRVLAYAEARGVDLRASRAYGDALADEAMLRVVGAPSVVSPKGDMRAKAEREGWPILEWA